MTKIIAELIIVFTLIFEVITITSGSALYPVFAAAVGIVSACIAIKLILKGIRKHSAKLAKHRGGKMVLLG